MKLQLAMVFVKDIDRLTAFYRDGLGLSVVAEASSAGWVELDAGGARFALHAIPPAYAASIVIHDPPRAREDTPIKLAFSTDDLDAACALIEKAGGILLPRTGPSSRDALDPEGNVFQIKKG